AFDRVGAGISWLATRTVRRAAMMVAIYLVVLGLGFSVFRETPTGFIPPVDRGYIIVVVQLPPGASLSRTDAVQQRALDIAFGVPGVVHAVNVVGFSGATFTNAPNSGALFLVLDDYSKRGRDPRQSDNARRRPAQIAAGNQGRAEQAAVGDPGRLHRRRAAAAGDGHRHRRRFSHDGRGSWGRGGGGTAQTGVRPAGAA